MDRVYLFQERISRELGGSNTSTRQELEKRNRSIYADYCQGLSVFESAGKYFLSEKSIQRIVYEMK